MSNLSGPYWKVPYSPHGGFASIDEVKAALPQDVEGLEVDDTTTNYPCVQFPPNTQYDIMKRVKDHLEARGFEVS